MAVYVDAAIWQWHGLSWCHLLADDADELHRFAAALGVKPTSYQGPPKTATAHYDITAYERRLALKAGAIPCGRDEIVAVLRLVRQASKARGAVEAAALPRKSAVADFRSPDARRAAETAALPLPVRL